jgi:hypothetical protein
VRTLRPYRKKTRPAAENFKKTLDRFLRIPEKSRLSCREFQKMIGSFPENSGKKPAQLPGILKNNRIVS